MVNSLILACLIVTVYVGIQATPLNDEHRLGKYLLDRYRQVGLRGRPVEKAGEAWNVSFSFSLNSVQAVSFGHQTIEVLVWQTLGWKDHYLKWNRSDFDVDSIRLNPTDIVMPDVVLYNTASETKALNPYEQVLVYHTGDVYYVPQIKQKALCYMPAKSTNVTCTLKYGSWTYDGQKLNLTLGREKIDLSTYQVNPYWNLTATSATRNVKVYACCPEPYIDLTFDITLKKK